MTTNDVKYIIDPSGSSELVALVELADELEVHKPTVFRIAKRLGIQAVKLRDSTRGNQEIALVSKADAAAIRDEYARVRRNGIQDSGDASQFAPDEGWFYLIKLEPEYDPGRFKVGFTTDLDGRLRHHRCSAPFATYFKTWPCKRLWERTVIDCMTVGTEQLHTEVFRAASLAQVLETGDRFFAMMPPVAPVAPVEPEDEMSNIDNLGTCGGSNHTCLVTDEDSTVPA